MSPDGFFADKPLPKKIFEAVQQIVEEIEEADIQVSKSQIAFRRARNFAVVWMPGQFLKGRGAPLVLTISLPWRDASPRWKEIVEPYPGRFTHHLELNDPADVDEEVKDWLQKAWQLAK